MFFCELRGIRTICIITAVLITLPNLSLSTPDLPAGPDSLIRQVTRLLEERDSNPRTRSESRFTVCRFQPLTHPPILYFLYTELSSTNHSPVTKERFELSRLSTLVPKTSVAPITPLGHCCVGNRARTYNLSVNSRMLHH